MPGPLMGVTIATPDLDGSCEAYARYLGYEGDRGTVDDALAGQLGRPALAGRAMATLYPESGGDRFIRLVEGEADPAPLTSFGWSAVEIIVRDLDALAEALADGPFRIIGPPAVLEFDFTDAIRAMQVVGPAGEVLYLTEVSAPVPGFDLPVAESLVGPPFIAVAGVPDLSAWQFNAAEHAEMTAGPTIEAPVAVLSDALGLPKGTKHRLTTVALGGQTYMEVDHFPPPATARAAAPLPQGIVAVAIRTTNSAAPADLGPLRVEWIIE